MTIRASALGIFTAVGLLVSALPTAAADIGGKWDMVWDTEGGVRRTVWEIRQTGEKITVETGGTELTGAFKDNRLTVEGRFYAAEAGYSATLKLSALLENGELKGSGSWDQYAMTFTGTRAEKAPVSPEGE